MAAADQHQIEAVWFQPNDPAASAHLYLALVTPRARRSHRRRGRAGPGGTPGRTARLPPGPVQPRLHALCGDLAAHRSRSARPGRGPGRRPERAGRAARLRPMAAGGGHPAGLCRRPGRARRRRPLDPTALAAHIATITTLLDTWRTLEVNIYLTFYDAVLGRLLIAAGQPEQARARLDTALALAEDTGMCFYDAELLRLRARYPHRPSRTSSRHRRRARTGPPPGRDPLRTARRP